MQTDTLRHLVTSFENDQAYLEITAKFQADPTAQARLEQRAGMLGMIAGQIRGEIRSRETPDSRPAGDAQRFEGYLEQVLQDYFGAC